MRTLSNCAPFPCVAISTTIGKASLETPAASAELEIVHHQPHSRFGDPDNGLDEGAHDGGRYPPATEALLYHFGAIPVRCDGGSKLEKAVAEGEGVAREEAAIAEGRGQLVTRF